MLSLSTIATALAKVGSIVTAAETIATTTVTAAETIYQYGASMIVAAEAAYSAQSGAGATKKAAVLAAVQAVVTALGEDWSKLSAQLSSWIDMVISAWKEASSIVTGTASTTTADTSSTAPAPAPETAAA